MQENIEAITEDVLPTIPNVIKFYGNELITLNLKRKDIFFIGQTISKYPIDSVAKFVNIIRDTFSKTDDINEVFLNTFVVLVLIHSPVYSNSLSARTTACILNTSATTSC